jgi:hypothetical protein
MSFNINTEYAALVSSNLKLYSEIYFVPSNTADLLR